MFLVHLQMKNGSMGKGTFTNREKRQRYLPAFLRCSAVAQPELISCFKTHGDPMNFKPFVLVSLFNLLSLFLQETHTNHFLICF